MGWYEVKIKTNTGAGDILVELMNSIGAEGCGIEDPNDPIFTETSDKNWDYLDVSELKFEYEGALVKAYFDMESDESAPYLQEVVADTLLKLRDAGFDIGNGTFEITRVYERDWENEWKKHFKPFKVGEKIWIKPTWESISEDMLFADDIVVEIDPGGAFGSGMHETTSMCMSLIEKYIKEDFEVLDIGCGSGILGVTAAKLGAKSVIAGDIDDVAVLTAGQNAALNGVQDKVVAREGDLFAVAGGKADIIVANIIADVITVLAPDVIKFLKPGGIFIASGIIDFRKEEVLEVIKKAGFEVVQEMEKGCWVAIALTAVSENIRREVNDENKLQI